MRFLPLIFKNVFRKKTRTILTIGSIILPLLVICLMGTFLRLLDMPDPAQTRGMFRIVTRHKVGMTSPLPVSYAEKIRQLDGALAVTEFNWFGGKYIDNSARNFFARFAVEPETLVQVFDDATIVRGSATDWFNDRAGCLVGEDLMKKFGWRLGDQIVLVGDIYPVTLQLTIRAVYRLADGNSDALFLTGCIWKRRFPVSKEMLEQYGQSAGMGLRPHDWLMKLIRCLRTLHIQPKLKLRRPSRWGLFPCWAMLSS